MGKGRPHNEINLRGGTGGNRIKAVWEEDNSIVETLDESQGRTDEPLQPLIHPNPALNRLYPGAVFITQNGLCSKVLASKLTQ